MRDADDETTQPYNFEKVLALAGLIAQRRRLELLDDLLAPLPENAEACAPRALLDC